MSIKNEVMKKELVSVINDLSARRKEEEKARDEAIRNNDVVMSHDKEFVARGLLIAESIVCGRLSELSDFKFGDGS